MIIRLSKKDKQLADVLLFFKPTSAEIINLFIVRKLINTLDID